MSETGEDPPEEAAPEAPTGTEAEKPSPSLGLDLSSLIEIPPEQEPDQASAPLPLEPPPTEPIQFESLEDFSHETPQTPALPEASPSGEDLSQVEAEAAPAPAAPAPSVDSIKTFSESLPTVESQAAGIFPFTLKIEGQLAPEDVEKLLSVLTRQNIGIREVDLEPQIAEGKILIPRISEYAGVLLIQALRGISARISFGPSDEIFSTPDTREEIPADTEDHSSRPRAGASGGGASEAFQIPVTNAATIPQFENLSAIDTVVAAALLSTRAIEAAASEEYEALVEALIRELRFKAHRRGANAITSLQIQLVPLTLPTDYRVTVTGTAVRGGVRE